MENKLDIKFKNQKQSFEITDEGLLINLNTFKHTLKYKIPFEDIKKNWHIEKGSLDKATIRLYTSLFLNIFLILCLIIAVNNAPPLAFKMICFLLLLPFIFMVKKNTEGYEEKHIDSSKLFYFIYTKKNAVEVDTFIELVYQKQIEFFRKKYFLIDPVLPYNVQYESYIWLYSNKYINENEYEVIKEDLDKYFNFKPTI